MPNYLKTFNYKLLNNLLPLEFKFKSNRMDLKLNCHLCSTHYETDIHLFNKCAIINPPLHHTTRLFFNATGQNTTYFFDTARIQFHTPYPWSPIATTWHLTSTQSYHILSGKQETKTNFNPPQPTPNPNYTI